MNLGRLFRLPRTTQGPLTFCAGTTARSFRIRLLSITVALRVVRDIVSLKLPLYLLASI